MKKLCLAGFAAFALAIVLSACTGPTGPGGEELPPNTSVNNTARGGTFSLGEGAVQFNFGNATPGLSSSAGRAVSQADGKSITIYIEDAGDIYELTGILDNTSGKFSVSSKGDNGVLYQMDGAIEDGDVLWTTMIRKKQEPDGTWTLESSTAKPEASISIAGDKGALEAGLPASWQGLWEMSGENERLILSGFSVAGENETNLSIIQSERINDSTYDAYITMPTMTMAPFDSTVLGWLRELMDGGTHTVTFDAATDTVKLDSGAALPLGYDLEEDSVYIGKVPVLPPSVTTFTGGEDDPANFYGWQASRRKSDEYIEEYISKLEEYRAAFFDEYEEQMYLAWMKGEKDPLLDDILSHPTSGIEDIPVSTVDQFNDTYTLINEWYNMQSASWSEDEKEAFQIRRGIDMPYYANSLWTVIQPGLSPSQWNSMDRQNKVWYIFAQMSYRDWMGGKPDTLIQKSKTGNHESITIGNYTYTFQYPTNNEWVTTDFYDAATREEMKADVPSQESEQQVWNRVYWRDYSYRDSPFFHPGMDQPLINDMRLDWIKDQPEYIEAYPFLADCATWQEAQYDWPNRMRMGWDSSEQQNAVMMYQNALFRRYMEECKPQMGTGISKVRLQSAGGAINCYFYYMNGNDDTITQEAFNAALSANSDPFPEWATEAAPDIVFTR